ncbi:MAG: DegT/DnrJ/EryC1/StrS family aminotransferase [Caldilineales bacterium]|nr:DegT/DnrJ/EryC1/StrS family aminotransferase [Caldilineales bacterium]MDW8316669.1 DegT/DnrJ/EryC1/StrS family aminotransferase [Anaerolineae bacterium]
MSTVPILDLQAAHAELAQELEAAALEVLRSGWYVLGEQVRRFEAEFAAWLGLPAEAAVGVNSGTDALHLALRACGVVPGDEVIVPSHTAVATVAAVEMAGATPVFADIRPDTYTLDPDHADRVIGPRARAIVAVHLYGQAADLDRLGALAAHHGLWLVEDCAQAHGARWRGRPVGTVGDAGCFSFYPTKNLGAAGDGGMVVSRRPEVAERVRLLRQYGWRERYVSDVAGVNSRLDELQAALLRVKLRHLERWNRQRQALAQLYDKLLAGADVVPPAVAPGNEHVYHLYVVRTRQRKALVAHLARCGVATAIHYPVPVHQQPAYRRLAPAGGLPATEAAAAEVLSLPMYPQLAPTDVARVAAAVREFGRA